MSINDVNTWSSWIASVQAGFSLGILIGGICLGIYLFLRRNCCCEFEEEVIIGHDPSNLMMAPLPRESMNNKVSDSRIVVWSSIYQKMDKEDRNSDCVVCLCQMQQGEKVVQLPFCRHLFHKTCIHPWLARNLTCPICRSSMHVQCLTRT
ncbi:RING-H2 finger protein ATL1P [Rhynchospora pubera]|uniref:RING-type E3 ubiquitin transferase n=1 Tax=Rhynchospora pubera TaxID=906938 RepID=A0AAV8GQT0_9POAL|nr:RING-H2 finger protein ATL1P [Rhynchospora pubera]